MQSTRLSPDNTALFSLREHNGVFVLTITGEQGSLGWQSRNEANVLRAVEGLQRPQLIVDLTGVTFGGSELIAFLFRLRRKLRVSGGDIMLAGARGNLRSVLGVVRLDRVVRLFDSVQDAVNSVAGSQTPA